MGSYLARDKMGATKVMKNQVVKRRHILIGFICYMAIKRWLVAYWVSWFLQGGEGGRVINIASMAGLIPGLGRFDDLGYTVSKFGAVSFTRYNER